MKEWLPKIIEFPHSLTGSLIRALDGLAWPCHVYKITIPGRRRKSFNLFEETVLRLLSVGKHDSEWLAASMGLPHDFMKLILARLNDQRMISSRCEVTKRGMSELGAIDSTPLEYHVRVLFRELVGGNLLPVVPASELHFAPLLDFRGSMVTIRRGTAGLGNDVKLRILRTPQNPTVKPPTAVEVLTAVSRHQRLNARFAMLRGGVEPCLAVGSVAAIDVDPHPDHVYLSCRMVIESGSTDFRITDPFGYGFSDIFDRSYRAQLASHPKEQEHVLRLKKQALIERPEEPSDNDNTQQQVATAVLKAFGEEIRGLPEINRELRIIERNWNICFNAPQDSEEQADQKSKRQRVLQALYATIEWALRYVLTALNSQSEEVVLASGNLQENGQLLEELACKLGLEVGAAAGMLRVPPGKLRALREGSVEMQPLIALAILGAANNPRHPFRRLALRRSDWLVFVTDLKAARDASAHGEQFELTQGKLLFFRRRTNESVQWLFPQLKPSDQESGGFADAPRPIEESYQQRLKARIALDELFGGQTIQLLDEEILELLIQIQVETARLCGERRQVEAGQAVVNLTSILQKSIYKRLGLIRKAPPADGDNLAATALRVASAAGFQLQEGRLPRSIETVARHRVRRALEGLNPSLGAVLLAMLLSTSPEILASLASRSPDLILLSGQLLELRGHGNQNIGMEPPDLQSLRDNTFAVCQSLWEI
jgi:hypothetical protein